jgi:hypothetical protein
MVSDRELRQQNRRVALIIVTCIVVLHLIAIIGVLLLN